MLFVIALGLIKLSVLFFYRRIFCPAREGKFHIITGVTIILTVVWAIGFFFAFMFKCGRHVSSSWGTIKDLTTQCAGFGLQESFGISDFIFDLIILVMPIPRVQTHGSLAVT